MNSNRPFLKAGAAAAALALAGAGGYAVHAQGGAAGAVNARPTPPAGATALPSFADIVQRVAPAVVSIEVEGKVGPRAVVAPFGGGDGDEGGSSALPPGFQQFFQQLPRQTQPQTMKAAGSGFFISADGYVVTNNHVVDHADKIIIHTADDREFKARVVGRDPATDLAVVKVDGANLPYVSFEDRAKPRVGDWVVAVGNPFNLGGTATAGIVSALARKNVSDSSYVDYLQIDAPINRGNSGGPTFDLYGRVVGVNTAIFSPSGGSVGIGFDIPADVVAQVSKQLISTGKVSRGYIGAQVQDVTADIAESLGLKGKGALVAELTPGGPAAAAGLRPGDVVLSANGEPVASATDLTRAVGRVRAGDTIRLQVRREGQVREIAVHAGLRPSEEQLAQNDQTPGGGEAGGGGGVTGALGLSVAPDPQGKGVRVAGVDASSDAAQKGLRRGDLILQAGGRATKAPADVTAAVAEAKKAGRHQVLLFVARGTQHIFVPVEIGQG
ncbi:MAG: Do family serine endopeptidase [Phenylobacterium sp.]